MTSKNNSGHNTKLVVDELAKELADKFNELNYGYVLLAAPLGNPELTKMALKTNVPPDLAEKAFSELTRHVKLSVSGKVAEEKKIIKWSLDKD